MPPIFCTNAILFKVRQVVDDVQRLYAKQRLTYNRWSIASLSHNDAGRWYFRFGTWLALIDWLPAAESRR